MKKEELKKEIAAEEAAMQGEQAEEGLEDEVYIKVKKEKGSTGATIQVSSSSVVALVSGVISLLVYISEILEIPVMKLIGLITVTYARATEERGSKENRGS